MNTALDLNNYVGRYIWYADTDPDNEDYYYYNCIYIKGYDELMGLIRICWVWVKFNEYDVIVDDCLSNDTNVEANFTVKRFFDLLDADEIYIIKLSTKEKYEELYNMCKENSGW